MKKMKKILKKASRDREYRRKLIAALKKQKKEVRDDKVRKAYYEFADKVQGLRDIKNHPDLKPDPKVGQIVDKIFKAENELQKYLSDNYLWD